MPEEPRKDRGNINYLQLCAKCIILQTATTSIPNLKPYIIFEKLNHEKFEKKLDNIFCRYHMKTYFIIYLTILILYFAC
jgi:hypothetical protein